MCIPRPIVTTTMYPPSPFPSPPSPTSPHLLPHTHMYPQIYISECFGTYQVGFTLIALGLSSGVVSIAYGRVIKFIPRFTIVLLGASINVTLLLFLFVWERVPSYAVIFTFAIGWGAADAVWHNVMCSKWSCTVCVDTKVIAGIISPLATLLIGIH